MAPRTEGVNGRLSSGEQERLVPGPGCERVGMIDRCQWLSRPGGLMRGDIL